MADIEHIITITTIEPYTAGKPPRNPVVTGTRTIKAAYVRGCLAANPTTYSCAGATTGISVAAPALGSHPAYAYPHNPTQYRAVCPG